VGQGFGDGDTIMMFGQDRRWPDLVEQLGQPLPVKVRP
jgi:hypothetical protein